MRGLKNKITSLILDSIFPKECIFCEEEGDWICRNCFLFLEFREHKICVNCNRSRHKTKKGFCPECKSLFSLDGMIVAGDYNQERIKKAIKFLKYRFVRGLGPILADFITYFLQETDNIKTVTSGKPAVVPMPLHWKRENWRGFNQAHLIGQGVAQNLNLTLDPNLKRIKYKKPQTKLKRRERLHNIKNSFAWKGDDLNGKTIILVDDVVTTGATMNEAAQTLKQNGAKKVLGVAVAGE